MPRPFWLDRAGAPEPGAPLEGEREADLLVVGGGLTGLWTALLAREENPQVEVVLLEGERIAFGASGRNAEPASRRRAPGRRVARAA